VLKLPERVVFVQRAQAFLALGYQLHSITGAVKSMLKLPRESMGHSEHKGTTYGKLSGGALCQGQSTITFLAKSTWELLVPKILAIHPDQQAAMTKVNELVRLAEILTKRAVDV
jgi:hypothetical protein